MILTDYYNRNNKKQRYRKIISYKKKDPKNKSVIEKSLRKIILLIKQIK